MKFITTTDINKKLSASIVNQIIGNDSAIIANAEALAIGIVNDALNSRFDITAELAKQADNRHQNLLRWLLNLTAYFMYERIPDNNVPPRVVKDYDDTMSELQRISAGKLDTTLTQRTIDTGSGTTTKTRFRWGSEPKRSHN